MNIFFAFIQKHIFVVFRIAVAQVLAEVEVVILLVGSVSIGMVVFNYKKYVSFLLCIKRGIIATSSTTKGTILGVMFDFFSSRNNPVSTYIYIILYLVKLVESFLLHSLALKMSTDGASLIVAGRRFHSATVLGIKEYL